MIHIIYSKSNRSVTSKKTVIFQQIIRLKYKGNKNNDNHNDKNTKNTITNNNNIQNVYCLVVP